MDIKLMQEWIDLKGKISELETEATRLKDEASKLEELIIENMQLEAVQSLNTNGAMCYLHRSTYPRIKREFRIPAVEWARRHGLDEMVALQSQSFASWCREEIATEGSLPAELANMVESYEKTSLRIRKD